MRSATKHPTRRVMLWRAAVCRAAALLLPILAVGAVLANLCYLAGPAAESYLAWLGLKSRWVTLALFAGGVLISFPLVYMFGIAYVLSSS